MTLNKVIKLAFKNLGKTKSKTILSCIGVAIGSILLILLMSAGYGLQKYTIEEIMSHFKSLEWITVLPYQAEIGLGIDTSDDTGAKFKQSDVDKIKQTIGVYNPVYPDLMLFAGTTDFSKKIIISGGSNEYYQQAFINQPNLTVAGSKSLKDNEISISDESAKLLGVQVGDKIDLIFSFPQQTAEYAYAKDVPMEEYAGGQKINITVANIYKNNEDVENLMSGKNFINTATSAKILQENYQNVTDRFNQIIVKAENVGKVNEISAQIDALGYYNYNFNKITEGFNKSYKAITYGVIIIGMIALLIAMFGITNTMVMSVIERTREIGLFKALGMTNRTIKIIFLCEGGLIGFIGGLAGIIISVTIALVGNALLLKFGGESFNFALFDVKVWLLMAVLLFTVVVSVLASLIPASRAAKIDPITALRSY
ncbi:MAG: FtsX-like permease family protein [Patescibacteria group bacterium]|jgi:putative ABC transport system permease protein